MAEIVVADAGPLIALARIGGLATLSAVFSRSLITQTVLDECLARPRQPDSGYQEALLLAGARC